MIRSKSYFDVALLDSTGEAVRTTTLDAGLAAKIEVPAKSLRVLVLDDIAPEVETHEVDHPETSGSGVISIGTDLSHSGSDGEVTVYAAPVETTSESWDAFVRLDAVPDDIEHATLCHSFDRGETFRKAELDEYPFEATVHVDPRTEFEFGVECKTVDGTVFETSDTATLSPAE